MVDCRERGLEGNLPEESPNQDSLSTPQTWADFKPPILKTPFSDGRSFMGGESKEDAPTPPAITPESKPENLPAPKENFNSSGFKKPLLWLGGVALIFAALAGIYYLGGEKISSLWNTQVSPTASTSENLAVLAEAQGPASWEGNYSNRLLPNERGGIELFITDPPIAPSLDALKKVLAEATNSAQISSGVELKSLKVKIAKAEVHLDSQTVVATGAAPEATESASKEIDRWETLRINEDSTVDLMELRNKGGALVSLGVTYLAIGHYTQIRLYVTSAIGETTDGKIISIDTPASSGVVKIVKSFDISGTAVRKMVVDFDAPVSVTSSLDKYTFTPVIKKVLWNGKEI